MSKKIIFLSTLFLTLTGWINAQVLTNDQIDIIAGSGVYNTNAVIYTPANYNPANQYPLVIFTHGMGEAGSNINVLYNTGLPKVLKGGYKPSFDFIMVAPQRQSYSVDPSWLPAILEESKKRWNIDESRIYLTGLSAGGWGCYGSQLNIDTFLAKKIAAIEVNSAATQDANKNNFDWFKASKTPVWAVVGDADVSYRDQNIYMVNEINKRVAGLASITIRPGVGHGGWDDAYSGVVKNGTMTMWDWLYQFKKGSSTPTPVPAPAPTPVPVPGAGQLINDKIDVIAGSGVFNVNAVLYTPANYSTSKSYPLVIYAHGVTEAGSNINLLYNSGLPKILKNGYLPPFEFIMVAPQHSSYAVDPGWLTGIIEDSKRRWNIDATRIYLVGQDAGGFTTYGSELNISTDLGKQFAAIVINSGATQDANKTHFDWFKTTNTPVWAVVGDLDVSFRDQNKIMVDEINKQVPGLATITIRSGQGHTSWDDVYNGTVKNGTKNMWDWMYQFTKTGSTPAPAPTPVPVPTPTPTPTPTPLPIAMYQTHTIQTTSSGEVWRPNGEGLSAWMPGDTVDIPAGNYSLIDLGNFHGDAARPITIRNKGGLVTVGQIRLGNNARYFKILGNGYPGLTYGIKTNGANGVGIATAIVSDFEIGYCEMTGGDLGIFIVKTPELSNVLTQYPNYVIQNLYIHHNYVHHTNGEGMYIGHTSPNADYYNPSLIPIRLSNIEIAYNILDNCGWDGIQLSNAREGNKIHHNTITNFGTKNYGNQQTGIILGGNSTGEIYNNTISNGTGMGIMAVGYGLIKIYNNLVENVGHDGTAQGQESILCDDRITSPEINPKQQMMIYNNVVKNPMSKGGIRVGAYNNNSLTATITDNQLWIPNAASNWEYYYIACNVTKIQTGNTVIR